MPGSECRKRIANFRNEGLKNQERFGDVEGSENWKRIASPKLPLSRLWNSTFGRVLAAFRGVRSFCLLPKPIDKPHGSQAAPLGEERRLLMESHHDDDETKASVYSFVQDYIEA
jgi:hypothetical protein